MFDLTRSLSLALVLALAAPAFAQDSTSTEAAPAADAAPATGSDLSMGKPAIPAQPQPYIKSTHGDWELRCIRASDGSDPCELYQLLKDSKGNSVAEITLLALPDGQQAAAGATIIVPLETLLTKEMTIAIDSSPAKHYPFTFCAAVGCFARIGLTADEIATMKKGNKATVSVVPVLAPDQLVSVDISLKGFTDAFAAVLAERPVPK
jgi:invasion protein IalB